MNENVITLSVASVSWIDRRAGLPDSTSDANPGPAVSRKYLLGKQGYRYVNFLEATIHVISYADSRGIERRQVGIHEFTNASGLYAGTSFFGTRVERFKTYRETELISGCELVGTKTYLPAGTRFRQTVGSRTAAPEKVGRTAGKYIGYAVGVFGGPVGAVGGYLAGRLAGRELAEEATAFPPIWSELELTIYTDGTFEFLGLAHSLFPSVNIYTLEHERSLQTGRGIRRAGSKGYQLVGEYDGVPQLDRWMERGWGECRGKREDGTAGAVYEGNPWRIPSPHGWGDQREAEQEATFVE